MNQRIFARRVNIVFRVYYIFTRILIDISRIICLMCLILRGCIFVIFVFKKDEAKKLVKVLEYFYQKPCDRNLLKQARYLLRREPRVPRGGKRI